MTPKTIIALILSISALAITGCGGPSDPVVTGTVTFDGTPVDDGEIIFSPDNGNGVVVASRIENGKYSLTCTPGLKKVSVTASRVEGKAKDGLPNYVYYIPKKYNDETELTFEVEASSRVEKNFDLQP